MSTESAAEEIFTGYLLDMSDNDDADDEDRDEDDSEWQEMLWTILRRLESRHNEFESGHNGLQFYHAQAIQAHLEIMVKGRKSVDASECDLTVHVEPRSYLHSNKWAVNPKMLQDFTEKKMVPDEAKKYLENVYMEIELFSCIHIKPGRGISLSNDGQTKSWILNGEQPLKKKSIGCGIHQSDVICSTFGWIEEASQSIEYGKNYKGYWDGELFVKQLFEKIIPAFERLHGPEYQALIMVDNSQGHSTYAKDALLAYWMNWRPSGKQASMRDGWFMMEDVQVVQKMTFPATHAKFPNEPKAKKWEHHIVRWMAAYCSGLEAKAAQIEVKKFSSCRFASHRHVSETVAHSFD
ncbi:hypothetical protein EV421DRAFT_1893326 [Armillaria borealis]|uniref:DDE-1 domain-containing protein n=1 Tax=Armillaria borealis TaxID=47425 RepID=A0AA39IXH7_9AGAR|nr:hypothetical protein EV421DRAFT_1893326 [Armillaria borealis]